MKSKLLILPLLAVALSAYSQTEGIVPTDTDEPTTTGIELPFDTSDFRNWTIINANGDVRTYPDDDGKTYTEPITWEASDGKAVVATTSHEGDDWLISPALNVLPNQPYEISIYKYKGYGISYTVTFDLYAGTDNTVEGMTTKIATIEAYASSDMEARTVTLYVDSSALPEPEDADTEEGTEEDTNADAETESENENGTDPETPEFVKIPSGNVYFGIHFNTKGELVIKNFSMQGTAVGVDEFEADNTNAVIPADCTDITVYDLTGNCVQTAANAAELDIRSLAAGLYIVKGSQSGKSVSLKICK